MTRKQEKPSRGRISSIDLLDEDIRVGINAALRERKLTQREIRDHFNELLYERGATPISRSALNRYSKQIEQQGSMLREAREAADALVGGLGESGSTDLGRAVTELVKTMIFDAVIKGQEEPLSVDTLNKLALITQRIERASKISLDRELKIQEETRRKALEDAAKAASSAAAEAGVSEETIKAIRRDVLRMAE